MLTAVIVISNAILSSVSALLLTDSNPSWLCVCAHLSYVQAIALNPDIYEQPGTIRLQNNLSQASKSVPSGNALGYGNDALFLLWRQWFGGRDSLNYLLKLKWIELTQFRVQ
jgi:hypothetical protein